MAHLAGKIERILPIPRTTRGRYAFAHRFIRGLGNHTETERYISWSSDGFTENEKQTLLGSGPIDTKATPTLLEAHLDGRRSSTLRDTMVLDFTTALPDCLLVKVDIATMANGLEARCPFLDQEVVTWALSLHPCLLVGRGATKPVIRALAERYLPGPVVSAPKRGFEIPIGNWLAGPLNDLLHDVVERPSGTLGQLFDRAALRSFLQRSYDIDDDRWSRQAWFLLMFGLWEAHASRLYCV